MTPRPVLAALLGHWRRQPVGLVTLLVGLAVATALWSGVQTLNAEARAAYDRAAAVLAGEQLAGVVARDGQRFPLADHVALRRAGWPVSPVLEGTLPYPWGSLRLIGIDPLTLPAEAAALAIGEGGERFRSFVLPPHLGLAAPATAARLAEADGLPPLEASAVLPADTLVVDIGLAERLLGTEGRVSRLLLPADAAGRPLPEPLAARLRVVPPGGEGDLDRLTDSFHLNLTAFGLLSFLVGLIIVHSAVGLAFERRKPMLRTLRACGVPAWLLTAALLAELVCLALVGGLVGVAAGYFLAGALLPDVAASLRGLYGAQVPDSLALGPGWWAAGIAMALVGALAAAGASLWRAWTLPELAPAQPEAWAGAQRRGLRLQLALAAALATGAGLVLAFGDGLAAGFAAMAGLLLGAALALPALLAALLALGARLARRPVAQWAWADARQQLSGLSLALMALLLALAVNIGVGTMVDSFRRTFLGYLDQRLVSDLYLTAADAAQARAAADWLAARPDVAAVLPIWQGGSRLGDWPVEVYGFRDHATYRDSWPLIAALPDAWDLVAAGRAVLVSEQLARRLALRPGDAVAIPTPQGTLEATVAAIYPDYGNPEGQVMVAQATHAAAWPDADRRRLGVRTAPGAAPGLIDALRAEFALDAGQVTDQRGLKDAARRVFERTFAVTVALNALTLAVAGIALLTSLLALADARLAKLAPLWAMGITRRQLARIELAKALALAALTAVLALPLGLALAWLLTAVVNVRAFGWRLPVHLFPGQWATLFALALATALAAALWPVWRLARASPLRLLQGFSNER